MNQEVLNSITQTTTGYPVRGLRWKAVDCIIVGQVKCPVIGKEGFNDGYVSCAWRKNGKPTNFNKGNEDFILEINLEVTN